ncbi:MAG: hypothetical protein ACPKPY_08315 [Nitrososphaeraceae archaeon]
MKGFEFLLLCIGTICNSLLRYKIAEYPIIVLVGLSGYVMIVNITGSFILGIFSA